MGYLVAGIKFDDGIAERSVISKIKLISHPLSALTAS